MKTSTTKTTKDQNVTKLKADAWHQEFEYDIRDLIMLKYPKKAELNQSVCSICIYLFLFKYTEN